jgi:hypothetical protein
MTQTRQIGSSSQLRHQSKPRAGNLTLRRIGMHLSPRPFQYAVLYLLPLAEYRVPGERNAIETAASEPIYPAVLAPCIGRMAYTPSVTILLIPLETAAESALYETWIGHDAPPSAHVVNETRLVIWFRSFDYHSTARAEMPGYCFPVILACRSDANRCPTVGREQSLANVPPVCHGPAVVALDVQSTRKSVATRAHVSPQSVSSAAIASSPNCNLTTATTQRR